jgi:hypothetical protein
MPRCATRACAFGPDESRCVPIGGRFLPGPDARGRGVDGLNELGLTDQRPTARPLEVRGVSTATDAGRHKLPCSRSPVWAASPRPAVPQLDRSAARCPMPPGLLGGLLEIGHPAPVVDEWGVRRDREVDCSNCAAESRRFDEKCRMRRLRIHRLFGMLFALMSSGRAQVHNWRYTPMYSKPKCFSGLIVTGVLIAGVASGDHHEQPEGSERGTPDQAREEMADPAVGEDVQPTRDPHERMIGKDEMPGRSSDEMRGDDPRQADRPGQLPPVGA